MLPGKKTLHGVGSDRDYERAYSIFLPLAQGGNAEAARYVGIMKFAGRGCEKSIKEARQWLSVAARKEMKLRCKCWKNIDRCFSDS